MPSLRPLYGWVHKIGPGFLIFLAGLAFGAAFLLQLLVSISLPSIRSIYFLTFTLETLGQEIKVGLWTLCTNQLYSSFYMYDNGETCQGNSLGYQDSQYGQIANRLLIQWMAKALALQPLSTALSGLSVAVCVLHLCTNTILWPFLCALAAAVSILTFVFEIILFSTARMRLNRGAAEEYFGSPISQSAFGPGIWIQLAACVVTSFATFMVLTAYTRRKLSKTHQGRFGKRGASVYHASIASDQDGGSEKWGMKGSFDSNSMNSDRTPLRRSRGAEAPYDYNNKRHSAAKAGAMGAAGGLAAAAISRKGDRDNARNRTSSSAKSPADFKTYSKPRKSVPLFEAEHQDMPAGDDRRRSRPRASEQQTRRSSGGLARGRRTSGLSDGGDDEEAFAEADEGYGYSDDDDDDAAQGFEEADQIPPSSSRYDRYNEPMDPNDDTVIHPRKGRRAARYSARMAELGLD